LAAQTGFRPRETVTQPAQSGFGPRRSAKSPQGWELGWFLVATEVAADFATLSGVVARRV
jgi:hypothetical protein